MEYSKRQLNGLIASIKIWIKKYKGECNKYGTSGCPLCELYNITRCRTCPIKLKTGKSECVNTPYDYLRKNKKILDTLWWRHKATKEDKLKELQFLIFLLPKSYQKKYRKYLLIREGK